MSEELKGTNVYSPIVPGTSEDTYPTHDSKYGMGGYREVSTLEERNSIPKERLRKGCKVYVESEDREYRYNGNGEWGEVKGVAKLSELEDVEFTEDPKDGSVLVKQNGVWIPASDLFIPTGEMADGTAIKTFDDLVGFIVSMSGGDKVQRNVRVVNNLDSKNLSASKGDPCIIDFTFISQERYSINDPYENTGERGFLTVAIKNTNNSEYLVVKQMYIPSGVSTKIDIAEFLTSGTNNIMVKLTGEVTGESTPAFVYTVQLTSLSISADNFKWWTAYLNDITIPFNIGGNVAKSLFVTVSGEDYNEAYEVSLGTSVFVETAFNYNIPHPQKTGVYKISAYIANADGSIRTRTISFNVICAVAGSQEKLIAINHIIDKATNWSENTLFEYTMYDSGNVTTNATFEITKDGEEVFNSTEDNISTSTKYTFSLPLEIDTLDNLDFSIIAEIKSEGILLVKPLTFQVNNSLGYSAVAGAVMYINPKTRTNRQGNREYMINEIDGSLIEAEWSGVNWGNDGWADDSFGYKVLRMLAGSSVNINYSPFSKECARTGKTLEIDYQISNVTDFSKPIITISTPVNDSFIGLNIYPDDVVMYSQSLKDKDVQSLHTFEEKRTRLTLTVMPDAYGNSEFNLCILYINGIKNREFTYENNDYFAHAGTISIGSESADVDIYGIREYNSALTSQGVQTNLVNWMSTTEEKDKFKLSNDILDANGSEIDFDNTVDQYNVIVFNTIIPSMADQTQRTGTLEVFYYDHPEWNVSISNVAAKGQGTSSMKYWIWNTSYKLDKNLSVITHADGTTSKKTWQMVPWIPAGEKFTAKKNFASSMQSHKIGAVNSYTDLYKQVGLRNEAMLTEKYADARVSVYELPFFCFEKSINDEGKTVYTFRGLYTFGPDKGDKNTFGYDTDMFPGLLSIEGSDNSPLLTLFRVPWNPNSGRIVYNADKEAWQYNGANSINFGAGKIENIDKWIPTYNHVYQCSPRLLPFAGTPDELNANSSQYRVQPYEFWIAKAGDPNQFDVYYYEASEGKFIPSDIGEGTINLRTQLADKGYGLSISDLTGKSYDELNTLFINARVAKFRKEAAQYWDIDDCLYFMNNVEFNAGTDERAKNTYPYTFGTETSKWRWRVDDADTRFDTTNRGLPDKEYSVETHDLDETGAAIWNGETNNFFNLMELAFPEEKITSMRKSMTAMQELGGLKSGNDLEKIYAFYKKYYFDQAQEYFPANGYNADAKYCYENGKLAYEKGIYSNDTDPITQSLGDHYLAEQRWITKRILYMMSKYSFGLFSSAGTDTITVRAAGNTIKYALTPAMDMYPAIANGTSIIKGTRTKAGGMCEMEIELSGSGDQQNAIEGASYLQDIGDWHDKNVQGSMVIQGKMLREIRLGHKTEPITISISSLTISNCISLQKLILSNIRQLSGALNLTACTHLKEVYADGTSLSQIKLPSGGGLKLVEFSSLNQYISLSNYPLLTNEGVIIDLCKEIITDFFVVDCAQIQPMKMLVDIMNSQNEQGTSHALKRIRAVGFLETYNNSELLEKLVELSNGTYQGLSSEGLAGEDELPVLDGTLNFNASAYEDSVELLRKTFKKLVLNIGGEFYIRFIDELVQELCANHFGDGIGTSKRQLGEITELGDVFIGTEIKSFTELAFTTVTSLTKEFAGCTNFDTITLPGTLRVLNTAGFAGTKIVLDLSTFTNITDLLIDSDSIIHKMPDANSNLTNLTYNSGSSKLKAVGYTKAMLIFNNGNEISDFWVEDCDTNNRLLEELRLILNQQNLLQYVRVIGFDENYTSNNILKTLQSLAEDGFHGINDNGERDNSIIPVMRGKLLCSDNYSPDLLYSLQSYFPHIQFNMTGIAYIDFKDELVKSICAMAWGAGTGEVNLSQAKRVTTLGERFKNKEIVHFDEFKYWTGYTNSREFNTEDANLNRVDTTPFAGCTSLESITLPANIYNIALSFFANTKISSIVIPKSVGLAYGRVFNNCTNLTTIIFEDGGDVPLRIGNDYWLENTPLTVLVLPARISKIDNYWRRGSNIQKLYIKATVPPTLENGWGDNPNECDLYVPIGCRDAYRKVDSWIGFKSITEYDFDTNPHNVK